MVTARLAAAAAAALAASCALGPPSGGGFTFAVMGDVPYNDAEEPRFVEMIGHMNAEPLAFVIHVGDIKAGNRSPCSDALFARRRAQFDASAHPLVYTPGDNEWTDCRHKSNGAADPLERLARLREVFFGSRGHLGGGTLQTVGEASPAPGCTAYPENRMWAHGGVRFATVNIPGPDNNEGIDAASDAEARCRNAANAAWIERAATLAAAEHSRALVIATQADPWRTRAPAFTALTAQLAAVARKLRRPVLFIHGDTHVYLYDTPFIDAAGPVPNALRLETYGSPFVGWVRVTVEPDSANVFRVEPKLLAIVA
jgi:hypothetical protein